MENNFQFNPTTYHAIYSTIALVILLDAQDKTLRITFYHLSAFGNVFIISNINMSFRMLNICKGCGKVHISTTYLTIDICNKMSSFSHQKIFLSNDRRWPLGLRILLLWSMLFTCLENLSQQSPVTCFLCACANYDLPFEKCYSMSNKLKYFAIVSPAMLELTFLTFQFS